MRLKYTCVRRYDGLSEIVFSPDSKHYAYTARTGDEWSVIVDGQPDLAYNSIIDLTWNSDASHMAYVARWRKVVRGS